MLYIDKSGLILPVIFAVILGLSNCPITIFTAVVSAACGYACADLIAFLETLTEKFLDDFEED